MNHIETAKNSIEAEILLLESKLKACQQIKAELDGLSSGEVIEISEEQKGNEVKANPEEFNDYPYNKPMKEKLDYLDKKIPRAWKMRDRLEQIVKIEGEDSRERMKKSLKMEVVSQIYQGGYLSAKYANSQLYQFYCRPEWLGEDKKSILADYRPLPKDFGNLPEHKTKDDNITWTGKIS